MSLSTHDLARSAPSPSRPHLLQSPLRVAINHGNAVLAKIDAATGQLSGVSVDIAQELAKRLEVKLELVGFGAADQSVQAVRQGRTDVGFFAIDPERGQGLGFTSPYVVIEGAYVVLQNSSIQTTDEVDHSAHRVAVAERSAYDLYLRRTLKHAQLVRTTRSNEVVDLMLSQGLEVAAGVKQQLEKDMQIHANLRMLQPSFMQIRQAMAASESNAELLHYLQWFVQDLKASGFVQASLQRHHIEGVAVAPL